MLPLLSITIPMETGRSSRLKTRISCLAPFSKTVKASLGSVVTKWPDFSTTVAWQTTTRVSTRMTVGSAGGAPVAGGVAGDVAGDATEGFAGDAAGRGAGGAAGFCWPDKAAAASHAAIPR